MKICLVTSFPPSHDALNEYGYHVAWELKRIPGVSLTILGDDCPPHQPELDGFSVIRCWKFNNWRNPWRLLPVIRRERKLRPAMTRGSRARSIATRTAHRS